MVHLMIWLKQKQSKKQQKTQQKQKAKKKIPTNNQTKYKKTPTTTEQKQNQKQLIIRSIAAYICVGSLLHVNNNFIARMALSYLNWSSFRYKNK